MPDQKNEKSTREAIDAVAFRYFLEKGYEATNLRKISEEVGIKAASIYFYYSSKKEMFLTAFEEACRRIRGPLMEMETDLMGDFEKQLRDIFVRGIMNCMEQNASYRFYVRYLMFPPEELILDIRNLNESWLAKEYDVFKASLESGIQTLEGGRSIDTYMVFSQMKRYQRSILFEVMITGLVAKDDIIEYQWRRFWEEFFHPSC